MSYQRHDIFHFLSQFLTSAWLTSTCADKLTLTSSGDDDRSGMNAVRDLESLAGGQVVGLSPPVESNALLSFVCPLQIHQSCDDIVSACSHLLFILFLTFWLIVVLCAVVPFQRTTFFWRYTHLRAVPCRSSSNFTVSMMASSLWFKNVLSCYVRSYLSEAYPSLYGIILLNEKCIVVLRMVVPLRGSSCLWWNRFCDWNMCHLAMHGCISLTFVVLVSTLFLWRKNYQKVLRFVCFWRPWKRATKCWGMCFAGSQVSSFVVCSY